MSKAEYSSTKYTTKFYNPISFLNSENSLIPRTNLHLHSSLLVIPKNKENNNPSLGKFETKNSDAKKGEKQKHAMFKAKACKFYKRVMFVYWEI